MKEFTRPITPSRGALCEGRKPDAAIETNLKDLGYGG